MTTRRFRKRRELASGKRTRALRLTSTLTKKRRATNQARFHDPPSDALLRFAHSFSLAALSRRPSLRSDRGYATRQAPPRLEDSHG